MNFSSYLKQKEKEYEDLCIRCGACCGAYDGDPCSHLKKDKEGKYFCEIYEKRLGRRKTVSGKVFECVLIREILDSSWPGDSLCIYKKLRKKKNFLVLIDKKE